MKKAYFKENLMINYNMIFKKIKYFIIFCICINFCYANDFTAFPQDNTAGYLQPLSTAQQQTNISVSREIAPKKINAKQLSLLKNANKERNGVYVMLAINMIPVQRTLNNKPSYAYSMGMGMRTGVISYLDEYIGMRGYFALDFTNDNLSPFRTEANAYNGTFLMASLGLDIMVDFFIDKNYKNTLGFFGGIGAGAYIYFDMETPIVVAVSQQSYSYKMGGNVMVQGGLSAVFAYHHRLEIGVKFLPTQSLRVESDGIVADYNPYIAYSYKFK